MALPRALTRSRNLPRKSDYLMAQPFGRTRLNQSFAQIAIRCCSNLNDKGKAKIIYDRPHSSKIKPNRSSIENLHVSLIGNQEISDRRTRLMQQILNENDSDRCILIIPAAPLTSMAGTEIPNYNLKQSSDFIYLSGLNLIKSLDSVLVLIGGKQEHTKSIMFTSFHDPRKNLWLGSDLVNQTRRPIDGLFDELKPREELDDFLHRYSNLGYSKGATKLFFQLRKANRLQFGVQSHLAKYLQPWDNICDITAQLDRIKFTKSQSELDAMRRASYIGSQSMHDTIRWAQNYQLDNSNLNECQLVGRYEFETRLRGSTKLSFWPVCASKDRATIIHYGTNDKNISKGDWVLMDAGCEDFDGYNSDITRTFPISPRNSNDIKQDNLRYELFEGLNNIHNRLIKFASENRPCLDVLHRQMLRMISELLFEFKPFVNHNHLTITDCLTLASKYCPHHVSHYLGLDLHDTPTISRSTDLTKGVCFTIEPGLYFSSSDEALKKEFRGIGYRIEDDCAINENDQLEVLSRYIDHDLAFIKTESPLT